MTAFPTPSCHRLVCACRLLGLATMLVAAATAADEPGAHAPAYADRALWPEEVQKGAFIHETWPAAPLYTWNVLGKPARETDPTDPANWTVDGKPTSTAPGEGDDVVFPAGSGIKLKESIRLPVRHLTVGKGTRITFGIKPAGNVWVKEGGQIAVGSLVFTGDKHTFLRNDNRAPEAPQAYLANKIFINKAVGFSIEILGAVKANDEMGFITGTTVVGPDAALVPGNRSVQPIYPDAQLVLLSGASFFKRGNQTYDNDVVVSGALLAGTPERPLTRDCTLGLSWKARGETLDGVKPEHRGKPQDHGLVVNPTGTLRVHSTNPRTARLVITWHGLAIGEKGAQDATPRQVDLVLQGDLGLDGVCFDRIRAGGILIGDRAIREKGTLAFGEHNAGPADALFTVLDEPIKAKLTISTGGTFTLPEGRKIER